MLYGSSGNATLKAAAWPSSDCPVTSVIVPMSGTSLSASWAAAMSSSVIGPSCRSMTTVAGPSAPSGKLAFSVS